MKVKQYLTIILPDELADLPVQVVRGVGCPQLVIETGVADERLVCVEKQERKYAFIWQQNDYKKVALDEILWIEAVGSYTRIHLSGNQRLMVSFNLAVVERKLPPTDFLRIHRSYVVNLKHVSGLSGNSLKVDGNLLTIGREYRDSLLERFVFLGVRRSGVR